MRVTDSHADPTSSTDVSGSVHTSSDWLSGMPWTLEPVTESNRWGTGKRRLLFPAIFLVYLLETVAGVVSHSHGAWEIVGFAIVVVFGALYLLTIPAVWSGNKRRFWSFYGAVVGLTVVELLFAARERVRDVRLYRDRRHRVRRALGPPGRGGIHRACIVHAAARWFVARGIRPVDGRVARARFACDVGVLRDHPHQPRARTRAGASGDPCCRGGAQPHRARSPRPPGSFVDDDHRQGRVGQAASPSAASRSAPSSRSAKSRSSSRRSLADVRAAVSGTAIVTLAAELATAREVLRAAGIIAELPGSVDVVDRTCRNVRLGRARRVTNVVRQSRAMQCTMTLGPRWIEIVDDGHTGINAGARQRRHRIARATRGRRRHDRGRRVLRGWRMRGEVPGSPADGRGEHPGAPAIIATTGT